MSLVCWLVKITLIEMRGELIVVAGPLWFLDTCHTSAYWESSHLVFGCFADSLNPHTGSPGISITLADRAPTCAAILACSCGDRGMAVSWHGPHAAAASLCNLPAGTFGSVCAIMLASQQRPVGGTSAACVMSCSSLRTWRYDGGRHWHLGVLPMYMSQ
eukprot:COSAG02_NODE_334_length_24367_cov_6.715634_10_plen_159_part_00